VTINRTLTLTLNVTIVSIAVIANRPGERSYQALLPSDNYEDLQEEDYHREAPRRDFRSVVRTGVMLYLPIAMLFISFAALESFKGSDAHMQPTTPTPTTTPSMILTLFHDQGVNERVPQVLLVVAYFMATTYKSLPWWH